MKIPGNLKNLVAEWFRKADQDLWLAELTASTPESPADLISFHSQQCAEKYLKGALTFLQVDFPKTHDLRKLCNLLAPCWPSMPFTGDEASRMTRYAISSRYPELWEEVSLSEAMEAISMAKRIREAVKKFLKNQGWTDV